MMFRSLITLKEVCFVLLLVSILHCEGNVLERLEYEEGESSVTITRCRLGIDPVVVPDTINGKPVTAIGDGVISACDHVRNEIILPKGITSIGKLDYQGNHGAIRVVFTGDAPEMEARDSDQGFAASCLPINPTQAASRLLFGRDTRARQREKNSSILSMLRIKIRSRSHGHQTHTRKA